MGIRGIQPDNNTYDCLIEYYAEGGNFEMALCKLAEANAAGFEPSLKTAQLVVGKGAEIGFTRLALDLADAYESTSTRRLDNELWVNLLGACARGLFVSSIVLPTVPVRA